MKILAFAFYFFTLEAILAYTMMMLFGEEAALIAPRSLRNAFSKTPMPKLTQWTQALSCLFKLDVGL
jgi:hypothetical protein